MNTIIKPSNTANIDLNTVLNSPNNNILSMFGSSSITLNNTNFTINSFKTVINTNHIEYLNLLNTINMLVLCNTKELYLTLIKLILNKIN